MREWRKSTIDCVNSSPACLCMLSESISSRYIMGEWWEVSCEYTLTNRCIAEAMNLLAIYINFRHMRANSVRMLLHLALANGRVLVGQKRNQEGQMIMKTIFDGNNVWMNWTSQGASPEHQWFVILYIWYLNSVLVTVIHNRYIGCFDRQKTHQWSHCPPLRMDINAASTICGLVSMGIDLWSGHCYTSLMHWQNV